MDAQSEAKRLYAEIEKLLDGVMRAYDEGKDIDPNRIIEQHIATLVQVIGSMPDDLAQQWREKFMTLVAKATDFSDKLAEQHKELSGEIQGISDRNVAMRAYQERIDG